MKQLLSQWLQKDNNLYVNTGRKPASSACIVYQFGNVQIIARTLSSTHMKTEGK